MLSWQEGFFLLFEIILYVKNFKKQNVEILFNIKILLLFFYLIKSKVR